MFFSHDFICVIFISWWNKRPGSVEGQKKRFVLWASSVPPQCCLPFLSQNLISLIFRFYGLLLGITFLSKSPPASCSCISQYGLPNYPHCCCPLHADGIPLSAGGPLPSLKNVIPTEDTLLQNGLQLFAYFLDTCCTPIGFLNPLTDSSTANEEATRGLLKLLHLAKFATAITSQNGGLHPPSWKIIALISNILVKQFWVPHQHWLNRTTSFIFLTM